MLCTFFSSKFIIANAGILYTLKLILRVIIENLRAETSFAAHSVEVFLTTCKSIGLKYHFKPIIKALMIFFLPWRALQCLHFPIAKNMKTLQWLKDLRLYNCMILAIIIIIIIIIIIMFIYSDIIVTWYPWILICHPPVSFVPSTTGSNDTIGWQIDICGPYMITAASHPDPKW